MEIPIMESTLGFPAWGLHPQPSFQDGRGLTGPSTFTFFLSRLRSFSAQIQSKVHLI